MKNLSEFRTDTCPHNPDAANSSPTSRWHRLSRRFRSECPACRAADRRIAQGIEQMSHEAAQVTIDFGRQRTVDALRRLPPLSEGAAGAGRRQWPPALFAGGAALVIGAAAVGILLLAPGTPIHPVTAFAQVEAAMAQVRTVTWRETSGPSVFFGANGQLRISKHPSRTTTVWARLESPALVRLETTVGGHGSVFRQVFLPTEAYQIIADPGRTTPGGRLAYSHFHWGIPPSPIFGPEEKQTPEERLRLAFLFRNPQTMNEPAQWSASKSGSQNTGHEPDEGAIRRDPWTVHETTLPNTGGRKALRFDSVLHFKRKLIANRQGRSWDETYEAWSIWIGPETHRILRREVRTHIEGFGQSIDLTRTSDAFQYNQSPPSGIFEVAPPVGQRYSFVPLPERRATPEEQSAIEALIRRAMDAWNRKDTNAYLTCWDFDYLSADLHSVAHLRRERLQQMRAGTPLRSVPFDGKTILTAQTRISGIFIRHSESAPFPPTQPGEFRVNATVHPADAAEARARVRKGNSGPIFLNFNIRRDGNDYRLISFDRW